MKKIIALLLALVTLLSLVACNTVPQETTGPKASQPVETKPQETTEAPPPEPVKITLYPLTAATMSGQIGGWLGDFLLEHGLIVEILAHSAEKLAALIASEELPDIMYVPKSYGAKLELAESGLIKDLEPYLDQMPHIAENEMMQFAMNYAKEYVSGGTLNMLPMQVGPGAASSTTTAAVKLNWDVYQKIGAPTFNNLEELIPILKKMQEAYPQTEAGDKTYGMHLFAGSDSSYFYGILNVLAVMGYGYDELKYGIETNNMNNTYDYILDDDSAYKYALKYFNTLMREGLIDPASISTERSVQNAKIEAGAALAGWLGVPGYEKDGYYPVWFKDYKLASGGGGFPYGSGHYVVVSEKTQNLDAVLKFLDMSADPEMVRVFCSGPEGEMWTHNDKGELILTEKGEALWLKGETVEVKGQQYVYFNSPWLLHPNFIAADGQAANVASSKMFADLRNASEGQAAWAKHYGYKDFIEMIKDKGNLVPKYGVNAAEFTEAITDDQNLIISAAKDIIVNASWKMVYAESDEEFEKIWANAVKECDELGFKMIYAWRASCLKLGIKTVESLEG